MSNEYWYGNKQAVVSWDQITCSWKGTDYSYNTLVVMNKVFEFWYRARNAFSDRQSYIDAELHKAGTEGFSKFHNDLQTLFNDFENDRYIGRNYDDREEYDGTRPGALFSPNRVDVPIPIINFAKMIERPLSRLGGYCVEFYNHVKDLDEAFRRREWPDIKTILGEVHDLSGTAQNLIWIYPKHEQFIGKASSYSGALSTLHGLLTAIVDIKHFDDVPPRLMGLVANSVPVLGAYYGAMVELIPKAEEWFTGVISDYCQRIDAAARAK